MIDVSNEANWKIQPTLPDKKTTLNLDRRKENILSKMPELENCQSIETIVGLVDKVIRSNYGQEREPGERGMLCTKTAVVLKVLTDLTGTWEADFPEILELNSFRGVKINDSFYDHTPVILKDKNNREKYVVDLTFSQFIDPETGKIKYKNREGVMIETTVEAEDNKLVKEILEKGYVGFDKLSDYLNLTVVPESRDSKGDEFWRDYYNQLDMESFSSDSDIDGGYKEIEMYLLDRPQKRSDQTSESRLMEMLTGLDTDNPRLFARLKKDKAIIRHKYGLPPEEVKRTNPEEYLYLLKKMAEKNGTRIRPKEWDKKFFKNNPEAQAKVDGETGTIVTDINVDNTDELVVNQSLRLLEHELVHILQTKRYPNMPIEVREYEANLVEKNLVFLGEFSSGGDIVADDIWGSVKVWYRINRNGEKPEWDNAEWFLKNVDKVKN